VTCVISVDNVCFILIFVIIDSSDIYFVIIF